MAREDAPGGLAGEPYSAVEAFFQQEALRYRRALVAIEATAPEHGDLREAFPLNVWKIASDALDAGDEAAG